MKKASTHVFVIVGLLVGLTVSAQNETAKTASKAYFGLGAGFDYGGLGLKAEFLPTKWIGIFAGGGFNLLDPAYNAGLSFKILPDKKVQPTIMTMYGYNAVIKFKNRRDRSETYYGVSVGAGCDIKSGTNSKLSFALLVPFRNADFHRQYRQLKDAGVKFSPDILPVAFSFGANFYIKPKSKK